MNYFRINLNKLEDRELAVRRARAEALLYAVLTAAVFVLLSAALFVNARLAGKEREFRRAISDLNGKISALRRDGNFVSEQEVFALDRLNSARVFWTRKLESLANGTGDRIALTELRYERGVFTVRGVAKVSRATNNFEVVSDFIGRLKAEESFSRDFSRIDFRSSSRVDFMDQDLLNFEIVMQ